MNLDDLTYETLETIKYIKIQKENIPYSFTYDFEGKIFEIEVKYNGLYDYFTVDLYLLEGLKRNTIVRGEKIVLNQGMFLTNVYLNINVPRFIPYDFSGNSKRVGWKEIDNIYLVVVYDVTL